MEDLKQLVRDTVEKNRVAVFMKGTPDMPQCGFSARVAGILEDLDVKFQEYVKQTGIDIERIKEWYGKPEQMSRLTYMITEEKVVKYLTEKAKIKEVDAKDIKEEAN